MATKKKKTPKRNTNTDKSYPVLSHRCTINTQHYDYQVVLRCKGIKSLVVITPPTASRFTALITLLTSGHTVHYYPDGAKVGIDTSNAGSEKRKAQMR